MGAITDARGEQRQVERHVAAQHISVSYTPYTRASRSPPKVKQQRKACKAVHIVASTTSDKIANANSDARPASLYRNETRAANRTHPRRLLLSFPRRRSPLPRRPPRRPSTLHQLRIQARFIHPRWRLQRPLQPRHEPGQPGASSRPPGDEFHRIIQRAQIQHIQRPPAVFARLLDVRGAEAPAKDVVVEAHVEVHAVYVERGAGDDGGDQPQRFRSQRNVWVVCGERESRRRRLCLVHVE